MLSLLLYEVSLLLFWLICYGNGVPCMAQMLSSDSNVMAELIFYKMLFCVMEVVFYIGPRPRLRFPPETWNVVGRSVRKLPRTTNTVESSHRNLERCIQCTRGRSTPLIFELLKCLRQDASNLKFDKEAMSIDPTYQISSQRKLKNELKDSRIIAVLTNTRGLKGIIYLRAMRAARKYI
ncbi:hypothetical protein GCK72_022525 [Caenorhabditis remanei]|uniref:Uncharacterized protein n=1 Tax=Caenorhabditis remanei TaxID=31234 RepID=A0A6A5FU52_CAERE|nr:hypothetical protein GCK72_022525 [Caenorhabditis remanei]KAF1746073.1 hypothetical protein GCK72_022525 [Caenorhabditis remanei]